MKTKEELRRTGKEVRKRLTKEERAEKSAQIAERLYALSEYTAADAIAVYASIGSEVETYGIMERALADKKRVFCPKVLRAMRRERAGHADMMQELVAEQPDTGPQMEFYEIHGIADLRLSDGRPAIPEPIGDTQALTTYQLSGCTDDKEAAYAGENPALPKKHTLFLLPGLVFNRQGNRIGYGGGFYDAYLRTLSDRGSGTPSDSPKSDTLAGAKSDSVPDPLSDISLVALAFSCQLFDAPFPASKTDIPVHTILTERENLFLSH